MTAELTPLMKARIAARLLLLQARWDPARMQATGLSFALEPWLRACWGDEPEELRAARLRHFDYFNTHPLAAWLLAGIICRSEAAAAAARGGEREAMIEKIRGIKTRLGASLAGLYDSFFWGALRPASAVMGLIVALVSYRLGRPHFLLAAAATTAAIYNVPALAARWLGLSRGYEKGEGAIAELVRLPVQPWIGSLRWAAASGALATFALGAALLGGPERMTAAFAFAAGLLLSWRGVSPLAQLGLAAMTGMAASASGLWQ